MKIERVTFSLIKSHKDTFEDYQNNKFTGTYISQASFF